MAEHSSQHGATPPSSAARSSPGLSRVQRFDESWVELASQPSSSSLSSIDDHIVTTGLRVSSLHGRRRRSSQQGGPAAARSVPQQQDVAVHNVDRVGVHSSGQEDYDESDSESELEDGDGDGDDRIMSSSAENVQPSSSDLESDEEESDAGGDDDDDDDDAATALGRASDGPAVFRPQPNAFSHPGAGAPQRSHSATSSMPPHPHSGFTRPSFPQRSQTRVHRGAGPSFMSPSVREDNDAALRASLTTLLSCAAAARGLPKSKEDAEVAQARQATRNGVGPSNQPMELRLVPESELMDDSAQARRGEETSPPQRRASASPSRSAGKSKRGDSVGRSPRASKKKRTVVATAAATSDETLISPTLMTWVVSAGVVVLVSVVGFGAGYVIGREVGRQEAQETLAASLSSANETTKYGSDVIRSSGGGLRRLRWGAVGKSIVAQA